MRRFSVTILTLYMTGTYTPPFLRTYIREPCDYRIALTLSSHVTPQVLPSETWGEEGGGDATRTQRITSPEKVSPRNDIDVVFTAQNKSGGSAHV